MLKWGLSCYYCTQTCRPKPDAPGKPFTPLTTHSDHSPGKLSATHFSRAPMPPHRSGTTRLSPLQYGFPPAPPVVHPLLPSPSVLLTVARGSKRDGTEDKNRALHQALTLARPSTSFCHAPAVPATLLSPDTPNSFLPQHLCTSCSFCQEGSSPRRFTGLALLCHASLSQCVTLPQGSSPPTPVTQPPTASATFQVCLSHHSFMTPEHYSSPPKTVLICLLLYHLCTSTWTQTPGEWAFSGSDASI